MTRSILTILTTLLLITGCTSVPAPPDASRAQAMFTAGPDRAKVFFYATYENDEDRPFFDSTFLLHTDNGDFGDIDADQFIELTMSPGKYTFNVDEILWSGNIPQHSSATIQVSAGQSIFVAEVVKANGKTELANVDAVRGEKAVLARTLKCLCKSQLERLFDSF